MSDKPILVNNQQEWERLAPVLDKQGYNWHHPLFQLPQPSFGMRQCFNESTRVVIYLNECLQWSPLPLHDSRPTQTVDEYLSQQEAKTENWEAKYKALEQGVKDAIGEIETAEHKLSRSGNNYEEDKAKGYEEAIEILKEKTGI